MKDHKGMRPQDIVILLAIVAIKRTVRLKTDSFGNIADPPILQNKTLADLLQISPAEVSGSLYRSAFAGLVEDINASKHVFSQSLLQFLVYGLKFAFPVQAGPLVRGVPTAHSAEPLKSNLLFQEEFVWEHPEGTVRGQSITPLYSSVPEIVSKNKLLYELLSLTDSLRVGGAREKEIAIAELEKRILE